ncbi:CpaF family protein [Bacillus luti]|nr:type II secretion system protein E [Bacillus cereus]
MSINFFQEHLSVKEEQHLEEIRHTEMEKLRSSIFSKLASRTSNMKLFGTKDPNDIEILIKHIKDIIEEETQNGNIKNLSKKSLRALTQEIILDITSLGKLHEAIQDETVSEVMVNAPDEVWIERKGHLIRTGINFRDNEEVTQLAQKIAIDVGRRLDNTQPITDARLPDGSRVHMVLPPITPKGTTITIRKFKKEKLTISDLINFGTISPKAAVILEALVKSRGNIVISGGTGSGKTTTLNVCSNFVPDVERVITIEDSLELQLSCAHVVKMEARDKNAEGTGEISIRDLIKASLRMRPDRVIVGEVRDGSAFDLMQACNTGHDGSMGTTHSNSPELCVARLDNLILQAGFNLPSRAIRQVIATAVDVIVQISRLPDGSRRITHISEVSHFDEASERVVTKNIFEWRMTGVNAEGKLLGDFVHTGYRPSENLINKFELYGYNFDELVSKSDEHYQQLFENGNLLKEVSELEKTI